MQYLPARPILVATTTVDVRSAHGSLHVGLHGRGLYHVVLTPSMLDGEPASRMTTTAAAVLVHPRATGSAPTTATMRSTDGASGSSARMLVSDSAAQAALTDLWRPATFTTGGEERVLRVARTIADLDNDPEVM